MKAKKSINTVGLRIFYVYNLKYALIYQSIKQVLGHYGLNIFVLKQLCIKILHQHHRPKIYFQKKTWS